MTRLMPAMITPEIIAKFHADMQKKNDDRLAFFKSDVCKRMIGDVAASSEGLDSEDVMYFHEASQDRLKWGDLTKEHMLQFIEVMSDATDVDAFIDCPDSENPFDHSFHLKGGLMVFMMHGQGTICQIMSPEADPEMYEQLCDLLPRKITIEYRYTETDDWKAAHGHGCSNAKEAKSYAAQLGGKVFRWSAE